MKFEIVTNGGGPLAKECEGAIGGIVIEAKSFYEACKLADERLAAWKKEIMKGYRGLPGTAPTGLDVLVAELHPLDAEASHARSEALGWNP